MNLIRLFLDLTYLVLSPFALAYLLVVSRCFLRPKYRRGLWQKLGGVPQRADTGDAGGSLWVHAVSVGEVLTAAPLVRHLRDALPDWDISVSVSTFTGYEVATKALPEVTVFYFPLDASICVSRALSRRRPTAVLLMELEIWPGFLLGARARNVPCWVANGRISERSFRRYLLGGALTRSLFRWVDSYAAQNEVYAERFRRLGVPDERLHVLGNLKHDRGPSSAGERASGWRLRFGWQGTLIIVGGSTHPGEEEVLIAAHKALRTRGIDSRLVLAPRHVERFVASDPSWEVETVRWSKLRPDPSASPDAVELGDRILLVDTVGDLEAFYWLADVAFVGGSLVPHGGHNLLEPAALGRATLFGPHVDNFLEERDLLLAGGAALQVGGAEDILPAIEGLLEDAAAREHLAAAGAALARQLGGSVRRHADWIQTELRLPLEAEGC